MMGNLRSALKEALAKD